MKKIKIAINAQINPSEAGGVAPFIAGLVSGLGKLEDGNEEYLIVTNPRFPDWLNPFLGKNQRVISPPKTMADSFIQALLPIKNYLRPLMELQLKLKSQKPPEHSSGFWESLGVDVIHFTYQLMDITSIPSVFNPHDLQHIHAPEFFGPGTLAYRNSRYKAWCEAATIVSAESSFVRNDIIKHYGISPSKVCMIYRGAPTDLYGNISEEETKAVKTKFALPDKYIFYPAQVWPHKNHIRLLKALALLRDKHSMRIHLVCAGKQKNHWTKVKAAINDLKLNDQVQFLGYVSNKELKALYQLSEAVVFPTLFEGGGFPLLEAFKQNKPVACSDIPPLAEVGKGATVFFDPKNEESIAEALTKLLNNSSSELREEGRNRMKLFDWNLTAKSYRALYRYAANGASEVALEPEDKALIKSIFSN